MVCYTFHFGCNVMIKVFTIMEIEIQTGDFASGE